MGTAHTDNSDGHRACRGGGHASPQLRPYGRTGAGRDGDNLMSAQLPANADAAGRPQIDYTNKDYAALRQAVLDLARYRLPEWTDRSPADPGMLLVDVLCYGWDVALYYVDRLASESFLPTAVERK